MNCMSNLVAHIALVSKQPLWPSERCRLSSLMSSTILNVARLFGNDSGLTMLSFDPKAEGEGWAFLRWR